MLTFKLSRKVIVRIFPTIGVNICLFAFIKLSKLSSIERFSHICQFTVYVLLDRENGFHRGRSDGDFLVILTESRHPVLEFGCKTLIRAWRKSWNSKLHSYRFYPSLCTLISGFLSGRSIAAVRDGYCFTLTPVNSGVPQSFVLSPWTRIYKDRRDWNLNVALPKKKNLET